jgi:putative endonuclease
LRPRLEELRADGITRPRSGSPRPRATPKEFSELPLAAQRGGAAERAVASWLSQHGFVIVATNLRVGRLELDVVARRGTVIVVVEVRTRGSGAWTSAFGSIDSRKRQRIRRAGERLWQRRYQKDESVERMRFDAASVTFDANGSAQIEYVEAAF